MTPHRNLETTLDAWFAEGPSQMPDRLFESVLDQVERVPQRRLAALSVRFSEMSPRIRWFTIAAAAAAAVLVAVVAFSYRPTSQVGATPTPTLPAEATPSSSPAQAILPTALQHRWNGPTRTVDGMTPPAASAAVIFAPGLLRFDGGGAPRAELTSTASFEAPDVIHVILVTAGAGCATGDEGTYRFTLSPGGGYLSLAPQADGCTARSQALSGDWVRSACPDSNRLCLGPLEAGDHVSADFNPFVPSDSWTYEYGRFAYTVPDGWANDEEDRALYVLSKRGKGEDASIWLLSEETAHDQSPECRDNVADPSIDRSEAALAAWLPTVRGLQLTRPESVVIGGLSGVTMDASLEPGWTGICPGETQPSVPLFADANGHEHDVKVVGDVPLRLYLLDLGDGRTLVIFIRALDRATYDTLVVEAAPIIDSFQFNR